LARLEPRRPRQASLRRAISSAYYALFHLLVRETTLILAADSFLRARVARAFEHADMKNASKAFAAVNPTQNQLDALTGGLPIPAAVQHVAAVVIELQEARHEADYNTAKTFTRVEVNNLVTRVEQAFQQWRTIRNDPVARLYLATLLFWKKWSR